MVKAARAGLPPRGGDRRLGDPGTDSPQTPPPLPPGVPRMVPPDLRRRFPPRPPPPPAPPSPSSTATSTTRGTSSKPFPSTAAPLQRVSSPSPSWVIPATCTLMPPAMASSCSPFMESCGPSATRSRVNLASSNRFLGSWSWGSTSTPLLAITECYCTETKKKKLMYEDVILGDTDACYVYALGSSDMPSCIGWPEASASGKTVVLHESLHWYRRPRGMVSVFDSIAESFRWMHAPAERMKRTLDREDLFDMDDKLGMFCSNDGLTVLDIWVLQDYEREIWSLKYQVELPVLEIPGKLYEGDRWSVMVLSQEGNVLVLVNCGRWLLYIDTEGKLLESFQHYGHGHFTIRLKLKPSLVSHAFFPLLERYAVNGCRSIGVQKLLS
uniref:Uncharacterized protein n=1 Tax=Oryza punctata TaxID=4537 RepID=A0A0E0KN21_ORYPU